MQSYSCTHSRRRSDLKYFIFMYIAPFVVCQVAERLCARVCVCVNAYIPTLIFMNTAPSVVCHMAVCSRDCNSVLCVGCCVCSRDCNSMFLVASLCKVVHRVGEGICYICHTLQHTAAHCTALQRTATHCHTLQHTATHCNALQHTATHCNTLQHTATHCNTLKHT